MQMREIEYVVKASETKNLTMAAAELHVSQPALSQTIKKLEQRLGVELFHRESKSFFLTAAGEIFVKEGRRILDIRDDIYKKLADAEGLKNGRLRVGVTPLYGQVFFPKIYSEFRERYPNVELSLLEAQGEEQEYLLARGELDVGIFAVPNYLRELNYEPIYHERMVLAIHPDSPLNRYGYIDEQTGMPFIDLKRLRSEDFLGFSKGRKNLADKIDSICMEHGFRPHVVFESNLSTVLRSMVSSGLGISLISWMTIYGMPMKGSEYPINYYNVTGKKAERTYWCAYSERGYFSNIMKTFVAVCQDVHEKLVSTSEDMQFFLASRSFDWAEFEDRNKEKR